MVLDDAGNGFRDSKAAWPGAVKKGKKPIVVVKMSGPMAHGALWEELQKHHADRMVVIINADDLRQAGAKISRRLSWERTAQDLVWQMAANPDVRADSEKTDLDLEQGTVAIYNLLEAMRLNKINKLRFISGGTVHGEAATAVYDDAGPLLDTG